MATFTVTTAADVVNAGDGVLSLREVVQQANAAAGDDTILFAGALEGQTLTLTQGQLTVTDGNPDIDNSLRIDGDADDNGSRVTISGGSESRVLEVGDRTSAELSGLVITGGRVIEGTGGGVLIGSQSAVSIDESAVTGCSAGDASGYDSPQGSGGGIALSAGSSLSLSKCEIANNFANYGGGIATGGYLTISQSYVHHNSAWVYGGGSRGGGISGSGRTYLSGSTIAYNAAASGGGITGGTVTLRNSTVIGNNASGYTSELDGSHPGNGGGILGSTVSIFSSTLTGNTYGDISASDVRVSDSIVSRIEGYSTGGYDPAYTPPSPIWSNGHNVFGGFVRGSVSGDLQDVAAQRLFAAVDPITGRAQLADNGGPVLTVALRNALDNPALGGAAPADAGAVDARGVARPAPATTNPDVGAFELNQSGVSTRPTPGNDVIAGTNAADTISGLAGVDIVRGLEGNDLLYGNEGGDTLRGGGGNDLLEGGAGSDILDGGAGVDQISYANDGYPHGIIINLAIQTGEETVVSLAYRGDETDTLFGIENADGSNFDDLINGDASANRLGGAGGVDRIFGSDGEDVLAGGLGNDRLDGGFGVDLADFSLGSAVAVDLSLANDRATRGTEVDTLVGIEGAIGSGSADTFRGDGAANVFRGQGGKDTLTGGAGADDFDLDATAHSAVGANRDVVTDFAPGSDDLDLATVDARSATPAVNDAFAFLAARGAAFTGAGQVRWYQSAGNTFVEANVDANLAPDLQVQLTGLKTLTAADFVL